MRKFLISIIVILVILLIGQLIYFNFREKKPSEILPKSANIVNNVNTNETEEIRHIDEQDTIINNVIEPNGIATLSQVYKGNMKLLTLEQELYTFIDKNVKEIYNAVSGKSINKILQLYDLKKQAINSMNIYSAEDFKEIATEILKVGGVQGINYISSNIDMQSYNNDENGYASFNITFTYTNMSQIKMKVYLANNKETLPNIKFGKQD